MSSNGFSRRNFLEILGLTGGGMLLRESLTNQAHAAVGDPNLLLMVYFGGGWDQLLALDPRDATAAPYKFGGGGARPTSGIYPAYQESADADPEVDAVMRATAGKGVQRPSGASNLTFGPAVSQAMLAHAADLAIIRGVSMDTLTHEVGRRFFITGKFPRGLVASGSSLNTVVAGQSPVFAGSLDLPNLVVQMESYNETFPAYASPVQVRTSADVLNVLQSQTQNPALLAGSDSALRSFEETADSCEGHGYDVTDLVMTYRESQAQARRMVSGTKASNFQFIANDPNADVAAVYRAMGIRETGANTFLPADITGVLGRAAIAGQALTQGLSQTVSLSLTSGLDDHFDLYGQQSLEQRTGWEALGRLLSFLKTKAYPGRAGKSFYDFTTVMVFSEFSRTPMINARDGRDHHLTNSCLIKGPGIRGNTVFGASTDTGMGTQKWNPTTGAADQGSTGKLIKPSDIHATLLQSMGLTFSHLTNQGAKVLTPLLR